MNLRPSITDLFRPSPPALRGRGVTNRYLPQGMNATNSPDVFWSNARRAMMLDPAVINLNTGSFGPLPRPVFERVTELREQLAAEPTDFYVRRVPPLLWEARARLARFLGGEPSRL